MRTGSAHCAQAARTSPRQSAQRALDAVSWRLKRHIVASSRPCCRRPLPCRCAHAHASAPCRSAAAFTPSHDTIFVSRHESLAAPCRTVLRAHNTVSWSILRRIAACIFTPIATQCCPKPQYNICIATHSLARPCARALPHAPRAGRPCRMPILAVSQGCIAGMLDRIVAPAARPAQPPQPYVTIQSIIS